MIISSDPAAGSAEPRRPAQFTVRIENLGTLLAPGAWVAQRGGTPLFIDGQPDRGAGLEALAEDGNPAELAANLPRNSGVFATPVGADGPGPLTPGSAYEFTLVARPGDRLSFATMYVQSNDLFLAPGETGIALFTDDRQPISGDITDQIGLWDAGTEVNEEPGVGANQAPRQAAANTGADEGGVVQLVDDGFTYPAVARHRAHHHHLFWWLRGPSASDIGTVKRKSGGNGQGRYPYLAIGCPPLRRSRPSQRKNRR